jgi:fluoroquinolone resistance protein
MTDNFFENLVFEGNNFSNQLPQRGEYANCRFLQADFTSADLSFFEFSDCVFDHCNLSLVKCNKTAFSQVSFLHCKMLGINFEYCNEFMFTVTFDTCTLNFSSFFKRSIQKTVFKGSSLLEVDFTEADLTGADLSLCELAGAKFEHSNLEKADLRFATNYIINPEINRLKKAKFSPDGLHGLLGQYDLDIS